MKRTLDPLLKAPKRTRLCELEFWPRFDDVDDEDVTGATPFVTAKDGQTVVELPGFAPFAIASLSPTLARLLRAWDGRSMPAEAHGFSADEVDFLTRRLSAHAEFLSECEPEDRDELSAFYHLVNGYVDVQVDLVNELNCAMFRQLTVMHLWRHLDLSIKRQSRNTQSIRDILKDPENRGLDPTGSDAFRDQGFTRARALVLAPTRHHCKAYIDNLLHLWPKKKASRKRLKRELGSAAELDERRPPDWSHVFGGNCDDDCMVCLRVDDRSVELFVDELEADVIVATPLGLRKCVGVQGEVDQNHDCLSSVEVVVVDLADVLVMQNWEHVVEIFRVLNEKPKRLGDTDIRRIKTSVIEGRAPVLRQTIMLSKYRHLEHTVLFEDHCRNTRGKVALSTWPAGLLASEDFADLRSRGVACSFIPVKVRRRASLFDDFREFFTRNFFKGLYARLREREESVLLMVPAYPDYLCLRKTLRSEPNCIGYRVIHEHSSLASSNKSRHLFNKGGCRLLVVTERFWYFRRIKERGAAHVVFYGLPANPHIFAELLEQQASRDSESVVLAYFCVADADALQRLVGADRGRKLLDQAVA